MGTPAFASGAWRGDYVASAEVDRCARAVCKVNADGAYFSVPVAPGQELTVLVADDANPFAGAAFAWVRDTTVYAPRTPFCSDHVTLRAPPGVQDLLVEVQSGASVARDGTYCGPAAFGTAGSIFIVGP